MPTIVGPTTLLRSLLGIACVTVFADSAVAQQSFYFSVGDNQAIGRHMSLDSAEIIGATFDLLKDVYGVEKIYWRGLQIQQMSNSIVRPEDANFAYQFQWQNVTLDQTYQINHIATQLAHDRGLEIWGETALYDWGGNGNSSVGTYVGLPGPIESNFRVDHPQWRPVDRYGMSTQSGPIEFAYPEARVAVANWLHQTARNTGYDGVMFHTFSEHLSMHYGDEYGFNDPIVAEFQDRYGVDIRRENFDVAAWRDLRGEYTTEFLSLFRTLTSPDGIKVGVELNGSDAGQPMRWGASPFPTAGSMTIDWARWVDDGLVDELQFSQNLTNGGDVSVVNAYTNGTPVEVSGLVQNPFNPALNTLKSQGIAIVGAALTEEEFMRNSPIPQQLIGALTDGDPYKRMRVLGQIIDGSTSATMAQVSPLLNDESILVRRMAIKALGKIGDPAAIGLLEDALLDESNTIRTAAVYALQYVHDAGTPEKILDAMALHGNPTFLEEAKNVFYAYGPAAMEGILTNAVLHSDNADVRRLAMRSLWNLAGPHTPAMRQAMTAGLTDADPYVRYWAAATHGNIAPDNASLDALIAAARSSDTVVAIRAADSLGLIEHWGFAEGIGRRQEVVDTLADLFSRYGDNSTSVDTAWGYETVGRALQGTGEDGIAHLRNYMTQRSDRALSENAWRILYLPQQKTELSPMTKQQALDAYLRRPRWDTVVAMADSFDGAAGQSIESHQPTEGTQWDVPYGNPANQRIVERGGRTVLELRRNGSDGTHLVTLGGHLFDASVAELTRVTIKADWLREDGDTFGRLALDLGHTGAAYNPSVMMHTAGTYWVLTADGSVDTGVPLGTGIWDSIEIVLSWGIADDDSVAGIYDVYLSRPADGLQEALDRILIASNIPVAMTDLATLQTLQLLNDGRLTGDAVLYWDNISVVVSPVPEPGVLSSLVTLLLLQRRRRKPIAVAH